MTLVEILRSRAWEHRQHRELREQAARRIEALEGAVREYLGEYDTPAKDYAYRAACRDKLRQVVKIEA